MLDCRAMWLYRPVEPRIAIDQQNDMVPQWLAHEVATVMADVLLHLRTRWGARLEHQRQFDAATGDPDR